MKIKTTKIVGLLLTMLVLVATLGAFAITASAAEESATLTFDDASKRTTSTTTKQIWEENGIKLTYDKGSYNQNLAEYQKPARFYAGTALTVEVPNKVITKIVFDCNNSSYATALKNSIGSITTGSVSVSSDKVTVTFSSAQETFVVAKLTAQVRMDSMTVTFKTVETACSHANTTIVANENGTHSTQCNDCKDVISTEPHKNGTPTDAGNGKHTSVCTVCQATTTADHTTTATDNGDNATHTETCTACNAVVNANAPHNTSAFCSDCGWVAANVSYQELTLTFNNTSKRTAFDSAKAQVWEENGIVFTNTKTADSTAIVENINPIRLYKNSIVTIQCTGMTKIVFKCSASDYTNALDGNATVSGTTVTVTFDSPVDEYTVTLSSGQVRLNSITVTTVTAKECSHEETVCTDLGIGMHQIACAECEEVLSTEAHDGIVCSKCDAIAPIEFAAWSLILQDNLALNYAIDARFFAEGLYTNPVVTFTIGDRTVTVTEFDTEKYAGYYAFIFSDLAPHQMGENVTATISATLNGKTVTTTTTKSIKNYCMQILNDASQSAKAKTLVVDLLNYGAASQTYVNKGTEGIVLVNADLTDEQKALGTQGAPSLKSAANAFYTTIENATVTWEGAHLYLIDTVEMKFVFKAESTEGLTVKITTDTGKNYTVTSFEEYISGTAYVATFDVFSACQMSEIVYVTVCDAQGNAVSNTYRYSIESYAAAMQFNNDTNLANLVKAMMVYGNSAKAYNE